MSCLLHLIEHYEAVSPVKGGPGQFLEACEEPVGTLGVCFEKFLDVIVAVGEVDQDEAPVFVFGELAHNRRLAHASGPFDQQGCCSLGLLPFEQAIVDLPSVDRLPIHIWVRVCR